MSNKPIDPQPDEMMQLLRMIKQEADIHDGKILLSREKLNTYIDQYSHEPDPDCPHDEVVTIARYKFGKKLMEDNRVRSTTYCGLCKVRMEDLY